MKTDILITLLSWEDRYILGLEKNVQIYNPSKILLFWYNTKSTFEWKKDNLKKTKDLVGNNLIEIEIDGTKPNENWFKFKDIFATHCLNKSVLVDITTMTRESIWLSLYNCKTSVCKTNFIYYKPGVYSNDWISRDPDKPRLLYKMSGIAKLGAPTLLLVTAGYDMQRLDSLIYKFEPKHTILFFHDGADSRNLNNLRECEKLFKAKYNIESVFEYNAYDVDASYNIIINKLNSVFENDGQSYLNSWNIILNSLGAKTSAITLFKIWLKYPQVALSYIPSKEYNKDYSTGIGESFVGELSFDVSVE